MNAYDTETLDRREFLRGAAALAVVASLGIAAQSRAAALACDDAIPAPVRTTLALWSEDRWIDPMMLKSGSTALASAVVAVALHGHFVPAGALPALHTVKAHYAVQGSRGPMDAPMYAWSSSAQNTIVRIPAGPGGGVMLSTELFAPRGAEDFYFLASGRVPDRPKLTAGTYVLAIGAPDLTRVQLVDTPNGSALASPDSPIPFEYLLLTMA